MSYKQAMKWQRKHVKGTRQPVLMHTESGFWPSKGCIDNYAEYVAACEAVGAAPLPLKQHYDLNLRGRTLSIMTHEEAARWTAEQVQS